MSDFFERAVADQLEPRDVVRPRIPSRFEPVRSPQPGWPEPTLPIEESVIVELSPAPRDPLPRQSGPRRSARLATPEQERPPRPRTSITAAAAPPPGPTTEQDRRATQAARPKWEPLPEPKPDPAAPTVARPRGSEPPPPPARERIQPERSKPVPDTPAPEPPPRRGRRMVTVLDTSASPKASLAPAPRIATDTFRSPAPPASRSAPREVVPERPHRRTSRAAALQPERGTHTPPPPAVDVALPVPPRATRRTTDERPVVGRNGAGLDPLTVHVTIGRVELRGAPPATSGPQRSTRGAAMPLDEYLRRKAGARER